VSDTYRTPDSPLGRALAQGRLAAAAQRAEREELDRANRAAVDELRATLAALDPPLAVEVAQERVSYRGIQPVRARVKRFYRFFHTTRLSGVTPARAGP